MRIRMNYYMDPDLGSGNSPYRSKSGSGNKGENPISIFSLFKQKNYKNARKVQKKKFFFCFFHGMFLHIYCLCAGSGSGFASLHTDPDPHHWCRSVIRMMLISGAYQWCGSACEKDPDRHWAPYKSWSKRLLMLRIRIQIHLKMKLVNIFFTK